MAYPSITRGLPTLAATAQLAQQVARVVQPPMTIPLIGGLGAGKTQWVRFFIEALGAAAGQVTSPTYVLQHTYHAQWPIHHFDFYRLESLAQVWDLGIDELFEQPCVVLIEWADKFPDCLPDDCLTIQIFDDPLGRRTSHLTASGPRSSPIVERLSQPLPGL